MRILLVLFVLLIQFSFAQTIAYTSFEEATTTGTKYTDTGDAATDHALVNNSGEPDVNFVATGNELGFSSYYFNSRGGTGLTDGDYVGITNYAGTVGSYPDGSQGFQMSDTDGLMVTTLDTVDVSAYASVNISIQYYVNTEGYESDDYFRIWVVADDGSEVDIFNTQGSDINDLDIEGKWLSAVARVAGKNKIVVKMGLDCNAGFEAVYFDNIQITEGGSANLGPQISNMGTSALVPLATEDLIDTVKAFDESNVTGVTLHYTINGGSEVTLEMNALGSDSLYVGTIPSSAYSDGNRVVFWSTAADDSGAVSTSDEIAFFAGTTPISSLKQSGENQTLAYEGYYARSTGVATVSSGVFSTSSLTVYMQDENYGAIAVHKSGAGSATVTAGNSYTIVGKLIQYNGLAQLEPMDVNTDIIDNGSATMPEAFEVNIENLLNGAETWESVLVKVVKADTVAGSDPWPEPGNYANINITDDAGSNQLTLRIDDDTDIDDAVEPAWPQNITGIFSQYDYTSPFNGGYQLTPRAMTDFEDATAIGDPSAQLPVELKLYQAYPNPFNPSTTIRFDVPAAFTQQGNFELAIYNSLGQKVRVLANKAISGRNEVSWDGLNAIGQSVSTGIYYAVLNVASQRQSIKLLFLK